MRTLRRIKLKAMLAILMVSSGYLVAQTQQKVKKNYPLNNNATITVDAQHTNLVFETWNRSEMQIEAFIDTKGLTEEEVKETLASWQINVQGDKNKMRLSSRASQGNLPPIAGLDSLGIITSEFIGPMMRDLVGPMVQSFSQHPLPPEMMESLGSIKFDHEAYERDGEAYLKEWEEQFGGKFGKEMEAAMEEWSKNFEKDAEKWGAKMEVEMEAWGADFEKNMEKWAENFGANMEEWGEQFGKDMEVWAQQFSDSAQGMVRKGNVIVIKNEAGAKTGKTLIVRMPKESRLNLDVRYGEVQLNEEVWNLQANVSHSRFTANKISGPETMVQVSYSPVDIKNWEYGVLQTNYVDNVQVDKVKSIKLASVSSDVRIGSIGETAVISGSFGELNIDDLDPDFRTLDISLENSEMVLDIPDSALTFNYSGEQSDISYPSSIKAKPVKSYDSELINGHQRSADGSGVVIIKAKFSEVEIQ